MSDPCNTGTVSLQHDGFTRMAPDAMNPLSAQAHRHVQRLYTDFCKDLGEGGT